MKPDTHLLMDKLELLGTRSAVAKAIEETNELLVELESLAEAMDNADNAAVRYIVPNLAAEYADVSITIYDTFSIIWPHIFIPAVETKRRRVYKHSLPLLLYGSKD